MNLRFYNKKNIKGLFKRKENYHAKIKIFSADTKAKVFEIEINPPSTCKHYSPAPLKSPFL
jgi:hypothetical protein